MCGVGDALLTKNFITKAKDVGNDKVRIHNQLKLNTQGKTGITVLLLA